MGRIFLIGDSLFTETMAKMLAETGGIHIVGMAIPPPDPAVIAETNPHIIIIANSTAQPFESLLDRFPDLPIIRADLNHNYVEIITSRRVRARRADLLAAIQSLTGVNLQRLPVEDKE